MLLGAKQQHKLYCFKQVDIVISKNQALQILYFNTMFIITSEIIVDRKLYEIHENLIHTKLTTIPWSTNSYNTIKHKYTT